MTAAQSHSRWRHTPCVSTQLPNDSCFLLQHLETPLNRPLRAGLGFSLSAEHERGACGLRQSSILWTLNAGRPLVFVSKGVAECKKLLGVRQRLFCF